MSLSRDPCSLAASFPGFTLPLESTLDALDALGVLAALLDEKSRITLCNESFIRARGYRRAEVEDVPLVSLFAPDEQQTVRAFLASRAEPHARSIEIYWDAEDGVRHLIRWTAIRLSAVSGMPPGQQETARILLVGLDLAHKREMARELTAADEKLRQELGQELHDTLASHLAGGAMLASALARRSEQGGHADALELRELTDLIRGAMDQVRAISHSFVAPTLEAGGLAEALIRLNEQSERASGVTCIFSASDGLPLTLPRETARHLYRIAEEAIRNAITHAAPSRVETTLWVQDDPSTPSLERMLWLTIRDDGRGLPDDVTGGVGMSSMQRRAHLVGARLRFDPAKGGGTIVQCILPLSADPFGSSL